MRVLQHRGKVFVVGGALTLAALFALKLDRGGLGRGLEPALAMPAAAKKPPYDMTRLEAVNETLAMIGEKYVDPARVKPKEMLLSALNYVQRDVAQVIVLADDPNEVTVRVDTDERKFRVDDLHALSDVSARLREVRLKQFQQSSSAELERGARRPPQPGARSAASSSTCAATPAACSSRPRSVADKFLSEGTIVSTVGASEGREEKRAKGPGTEPPYPLVVLVNGNSASASEIVAGALKGNDRALIVGQQTFGKGSVQLVFPDVTPEKAALKLTIAQYLTPGDVSIQGVGVTPDIELDPMTVDDVEMDLSPASDGLRERDLSAHLANSRAAPAGKPGEVVRYDLSSADREAIRDRGGELDDDDFQVDFPIRFARDLAARLAARTEAPRASSAPPTTSSSRPASDELGKVSADLAKLGVDWSDAPDGQRPGRRRQGSRGEDRDRPAEQRGHRRRADGAPRDRDQQRQAAGLSPARHDRERQPLLREQGARLREDRRRARAARPGSPLGWCDVEGRKAGSSKPKDKNAKRTCKIPMDALDAERRPAGEVRRGRGRRAGAGRDPAHRARARAARCSSTATRSPTTAAATATAASRRASRSRCT